MTQATDDHIRSILETTKTIALVGFSNKPDRASHKVALFLAERGYREIPVNPGLAGQDFMGEPIVADLASIPEGTKVDMLDVFRRAEHVPPVVEAALAHLPGLKTIWLQLGITSQAARAQAEDAGIGYVEDRCPKIEHERLFG